MVYLIIGEQGSGKTTLARLIAKKKNSLWLNADNEGNFILRLEDNNKRSLHSSIGLIVIEDIEHLSPGIKEYANNRHEDVIITSAVYPDNSNIPVHWTVCHISTL